MTDGERAEVLALLRAGALIDVRGGYRLEEFVAIFEAVRGRAVMGFFADGATHRQMAGIPKIGDVVWYYDGDTVNAAIVADILDAQPGPAVNLFRIFSTGETMPCTNVPYAKTLTAGHWSFRA